MRELSQKDYQLIQYLVSSTENGMHKLLKDYLKTKYENLIVQPNYIVALGDIPIALVAHMDTVFKYPATTVYYDREKGVLWSPDGLGADDRAGIFAALKLVGAGLRPSLIFTKGEEVGGIGATELAKLPCPIPNLKYMIELDRHGTNDAVFYTTGTSEFIKYVEEFGFVERFGTFSDISILADAWQICAVNLSIGYEDEHSETETLHIAPLFDTIRKVKKMLTVSQIPDFVYKAAASNWGGFYLPSMAFGDDNYIRCGKCNGLFYDYEVLPVKVQRPGRWGDHRELYCVDCLSEVEWCEKCQMAFEPTNSAEETLCEDCKDDRGN